MTTELSQVRACPRRPALSVAQARALSVPQARFSFCLPPRGGRCPQRRDSSARVDGRGAAPPSPIGSHNPIEIGIVLLHTPSHVEEATFGADAPGRRSRSGDPRHDPDPVGAGARPGSPVLPRGDGRLFFGRPSFPARHPQSAESAEPLPHRVQGSPGFARRSRTRKKISNFDERTIGEAKSPSRPSTCKAGLSAEARRAKAEGGNCIHKRGIS